MSTHSTAELIERLVRADVRAAASYHVQDARGLLKLDAMENPYPWPRELLDEIALRLHALELNRYPDAGASGLKERLREAFSIAPHWDLLLGNGSDEVIQILITALGGPGLTVLAPGPSFVMFRVITQWAGAGFQEVPLGPDFGLDLAAMLEAIERCAPRLIFIACPNNPTGNLFDEAALRTVLEASDALVVIDEAYSAFSSRDHLSWLEQYPNLVVMRTLSKLGLAGLRLGFLVGEPRWIREFDKVRLPYNIGTLNQAAAEVALAHFDALRAQSESLVAGRARLFAELCRDPRLQCWPSEANFLLVRVRAGGARAVHAGMTRRGVLVKCLDGAHPQLAECLRFTVGTPDQNALALAALQGALAEQQGS